jgi:nucleotide-binding universal stress UspA family protein
MSEEAVGAGAVDTDDSGIPPKPADEGSAATQDSSAAKNAGGKHSGKSGHGSGTRLAEDKSQLSTLLKSVRKQTDGKLILVPVDFSDHSRKALLFAAKMAQMTSSTLVVLHVVHDPGEMPGYYAQLVKRKRVARIQDIAKEVFDDFMRKIIKEHANLKTLRRAHCLMVVGLPVTRILQVAEKVEPFLVVMGSQGRTGLKHLFLGSKAEQVVQLCPFPVTIVKQKA